MKKTIYSIFMCLGIVASGLLSSCSEDMPNVNFVNVVSNTSDFRGVIEAIKNQTLTLTQKLDLVSKSLEDTQTTLEQKLLIIEAAVNNGVATYQDLATKLIKSINALNEDQNKKLEAIYNIIASNNATLEQKLADIEAAIKAGFGKYEEYAQALIQSIKELQASQSEKLQFIHDILDSELASLSLKVESLSVAVEQGFLDNKAAINALYSTLVLALQDNNADLVASLAEIKTAIDKVKQSIDLGFWFENNTIAALSAQVIGAINDNAKSESYKLYVLAGAINVLTGNISAENAQVITLLEQLRDAIEKRSDYSEIIKAINELAEKLKA